MNNHRLLTGLLCATLSGAGTCAYGQPRVVSIEELFETAESRSIQMRPALSAEEEAARDISVAKSGRPTCRAKDYNIDHIAPWTNRPQHICVFI